MSVILDPVFKAVEELLPSHMMLLAVDKLYKDGYEIRLDTRGYLNRGIINILKPHSESTALQIAMRTDDYAKAIMRYVDFDEAVTALMAVSMVICKLVEERLYHDEKNQSVLSALMILADAREDDNPDMAPKWNLASEKAGRMFDEIMRQGFYNHTVVSP